MANRNATPNYTFEQWRVEFNNLSDDLGDFNTGIIGSVPSGTNTHVTAENAVRELIQDIDSIIDGTHQFTGDITFQSDVSIVGDLSIDGNITIGNQDTDTLNIVADLGSNLIPDVDNNYDIGSSSKGWRNLFVDTEATLASAKISDLTSQRVVLAGTAGELEDSANLTFDGSVLTTDNLSAVVSATLASAQVSDLTNQRVVLAGTAGELEDSANLTFDGTLLTTTNLSVTTNTTLASAQVSDLTDGRVVLVGASGELQDSSDFTYLGSTFNSTNLNVNTEAILASAKVSDLTPNRIVLAGTSGELEDDATFVFDGSTFYIGFNSEFTVDVASGNTQVKGTLDVDGQGTISSLNVQDLTNNHIVLSGLNGELEEDANFTFDGTTFNIGSAGEFTVDVASGNTFINGTLETNGQATLATAVVENLTSGRIVLAGTSSALEDNTNLTFDGTTLSVTGDISAQDLYASNIAYLQGTTGSTSTSTGALVVSGGTGIAENLYVGGNINATGSVNASSFDLSSGETLATTGFSIAISVALG